MEKLKKYKSKVSIERAEKSHYSISKALVGQLEHAVTGKVGLASGEKLQRGAGASTPDRGLSGPVGQ